MVRALFVARAPAWQAFSSAVESECELHFTDSWPGGVGGTVESRIRQRVELLKRVQRWHSLRLKKPSCSRNLGFKLAGSWRNGDLLIGYPRKFRRRSKVEPLIVVRVGSGDAEDLVEDKGENLATENDEKIEAIASTTGEDGVGSSEGFLDVTDKIEVLKDLELQPSVSKRGWLSQLKIGFGALIGFLPLVPVQVCLLCNVQIERSEVRWS